MKTISYFKKALIFALAIILLHSCEEGDLPNSDNTQIDRLKWSYDFEDVMAFSLLNNVPAIDEAGNIYFIADVQYGGQIAKLDPNGNELWSVNETDFPLSRVIFFNGKLFYQNNNQLVCRDAANGSELWATDVVLGYQTFALTPEKIYTTNFEDGGIFGCNNSLVAFDHSGNLVWETKIKYSPNDTITYPNAISVVGNEIYLGIFVEVNNSEFAIVNYTDEGTGVTQNWSWLSPDHASVGGGSPRIKDFAIDDNNNIIFGMEIGGTQTLFSINALGTENWRSATALPEIISSVSVDGNGNCYAAYSDVEKVNAEGIVWESDYNTEWIYDGFTSKAPVISMLGNLSYENTSRIAASIGPDGAFLWEQFYGCDLCNDEFHNIAINRNGDIIVIGKANIYCFEGDGSALSDKGWPKQYGNYGNTSSK